MIVKFLSDSALIKPRKFVGQAKKFSTNTGMTQKAQIAMLQEFRNGSVNVLVATNVAEEGLDIAECNLVIFYDNVASDIRYIQRSGRTGRSRKGMIVILYTGRHFRMKLICG